MAEEKMDNGRFCFVLSDQIKMTFNIQNSQKRKRKHNLFCLPMVRFPRSALDCST